MKDIKGIIFILPTKVVSVANVRQLIRLKLGVKAWNEWRRRTLECEVDLREANLNGANLNGANLNGANLSGANFNEANLNGADLNGANLSGANLSNANLSGGAHLNGANLNGANLSGADLRVANLSGANLSLADFTGANLTWANLNGANLNGAHLSGTDLSGQDLREANLRRADLRRADLRGAHLNGAHFNGADLGGANLNGAYLDGAHFNGANLNGADLSGAYLRKANLSGADLRRAVLYIIQALSTDFTGTILTGACIEDWNINSQTKLNEVECDYVYLKYPNRERRPSDPNQNFAPGEFTKLFQKVFNTIDLIFADGIDWKAFFQSFQELRQQYSNENLSIQAIEKKSGEAFVIRLEVSAELDKAEIEREAIEKYETRLQLLEVQYHTQLQAKDREIEIYRRQGADLMELSRLMASRQMINNVEARATAESQSMAERNINTGGGSYYETINTGGGNYIQGNYVNMSQDLTEAAGQIQELLNQLQKSGVTVEAAQEQVATDLAKQAESNPTVMGKLVGWGKTMANKASETTVSEAAKAIVPLALKLVGIPLP